MSTGIEAAALAIAAKASSDIIIIDSNLSDVQSDVIIIMSDLKIVQSDIKALASNIVADIQSDLNVVLSNLTADIQSDLAVVVTSLAPVTSDIAAVKSDIVIIDSNLSDVQSDIIVLDAVADSIKSDLIVADALIDTIKSDIIAVCGTQATALADDVGTTIPMMGYLKALIQELDQRYVPKAACIDLPNGSYVDIVNITDKGVLTGVAISMDTSTTSVHLKITIDSTVILDSEAATTCPFLGVAGQAMSLAFHHRFNTSLRVEAKAAGGTANGFCSYTIDD